MRTCALALLLSLAAGGLGAQDLVPRPVRLEPAAGSFTLVPGTRIAATGEARAEAQMLRDYLRPATGLALEPAAEGGAGDIVLALDPGLARLGEEGYTLDSGPAGVTIRALRPAGLFYGIQTLRQLLPPEIYRRAPVPGTVWRLPALRIEDRPRFGWRGSHLDVVRHFLPREFVLKHLELMAQHKLNVFHWHLTDNEGWRLELKRHPKLTSVGAWRRESAIGPWVAIPNYRFDGQPHGGFYSQDDVREVVAYATARHITVVPEIEMPGHSGAAMAAYPELGNFPENRKGVTTYWTDERIFSVEESTITFLQDVLAEVMELFPGPYIHIGGDECPKDEWSRAPSALARLKQLKLVPEATTSEDLRNYRGADGEPATHPALDRLQSWFIGRMDSFIAGKGRRMVGWDEILEGGLAPGATVMSWRGEEGGIQAARQDHDVVMAPTSNTYLDFDQADAKLPGYREGFTIGTYVGLEKVYGYDPVPPQIPPDKRHHVLGAQAQLWTEFVPDPRRAEYMLWPRLGAMSEVLWTPLEGKDFHDFQKRLGTEYKRLDAQDVNYRTPAGPRWPF